METTPRDREIVAVLRAMLVAPGVGPHLSRYWQYCPSQSAEPMDALGNLLLGKPAIELPPAFTFLEWLYLTGLERGQDGVLRGVGRQAFYTLLASLGPIMTRTAPGFETLPVWAARLPGDRAREFPEHLQVMFKIAEHYLAAEFSETFHRQCIPVEVVAALPWNEVTAPWLVAAKDAELWHRRRDLPTIQLLTLLITASFGFDARFQTAFWDLVGAEDLLALATSEWRLAFHRRMRREGLTLSDEVLAANFPIPSVVAHVPAERIERFLAVLWDWLGGSDCILAEERRRTPPPPPPED